MLQDLLLKHKDLLNPFQKAAVEEQIEQRRRLRDFVKPDDMTDVEHQSAFILFERVYCETPVVLFGQDVPSIAHTLVRIFRSRGDDLAPAEELFTARISEKALTECMLSGNFGDKGAPMTVTRLGDSQLPELSRKKTTVERAASARDEEASALLRKRMNDLTAVMTDDLVRPNARLKEAAEGLKYNVRDVLSTKFSIERHFEGMCNARNEILTEASHAALHAEKVSANLKGGTIALPGPSSSVWDKLSEDNPLVHHMFDDVPENLREGIRTMIAAEVKELTARHPKLANRISEKDDGIHIEFGTGRGLTEVLEHSNNRDEDRDTLKKLADIWNHIFNPSIAEDRVHYHPTQASIKLSNRQGFTGHIHSSFPPVSESYFAIRIEPAYLSNRYGGMDLSSRHSSLFEIEIVAQDLMTALRGHPEGKPVPCSLRAVAGHHLARVDRPQSQISHDIEGIDKSVKESAQAKILDDALEQVIKLANAKRSGKKWRQEFDASVQQFTKILDETAQFCHDATNDGRRHVNQHVAENAKAMLAEISNSLPDNVLQVLGLPES